METGLRILMLEDLEDDAGLIEKELKRAKMFFTFQRVDTRDEFIEALETFHPDVILSDHAMPQFNSIEALRLCHAKGLIVPFVLVTGTVSEEFAVNCLKQGVDDYILKSNLSRLPSAITSAMRHHAALRQKREAEISLKEQNDELVKINKELDSFVYSVSHNLRGPLASVLGLINLTRLRNNEFDAPTYFGLIERRIKNLDYTIKQILDHSKNSRVPVYPDVVFLRSLIDDILWQLEYLQNFKKTETRIEIPTSMRIISDKYRLTVILQNLMANAFKYHDVSKEQHWIVVQVKQDNERIAITVEDNGIGMNDEVKQRACDMFFRGTNESDGAGLGLYIARESVAKLGGKLLIESEWQKGTRIVVSLPLMHMEIPN